MASFNLELNNKPSRKGTFTIFVRITQNRKSKRIKTNIELQKPTDWNKEKQRIRISEPNAKVWNQELEKELTRAKAAFSELQETGSVSSVGVVRKLKGDDQTETILSYSRNIRERLRLQGQLGSFQKYGTFVNILADYIESYYGGQDVRLNELTPEFVAAFSTYLQTLPNHRAKGAKLHPNTIAKILKTFRAIVNKSIDEGFLKPDHNPFRAIKIREIPNIKERLSASEVIALDNLELEPNGARWNARNLFFFSMYCAGIRVGDAMQLRWNDISEGRLIYQMGKNNKIKDIVLVDPAKQILKLYQREDQKPTDYIFPYLNSKAAYAKQEVDFLPVEQKEALFYDIHKSNIQINRRLRDILKQAGIEKHISFHDSRHSFAHMAKEAGTDNATLKALLNHSSLSVTERYMGSFGSSHQDQALEQIFQKQQEASTEAAKEGLLKALKALGKDQILELLDTME